MILYGVTYILFDRFVTITCQVWNIYVNLRLHHVCVSYLYTDYHGLPDCNVPLLYGIILFTSDCKLDRGREPVKAG